MSSIPPDACDCIFATEKPPQRMAQDLKRLLAGE
jgi:hypothetical protein